MKSFKLFRPKGQALVDYNYLNSHDKFNLKHVLKSNASWLVDDAFSVAVARLDGARSNFEVCVCVCFYTKRRCQSFDESSKINLAETMQDLYRNVS